jgi:hypothetical protein
LTVLSLYLIRSIIRITASVERIEKDVHKTADNMNPVLIDLSVIINELKVITGQAKINIGKIGMLTDSLTSKGYEILDILDSVQIKANNYMSNGKNFFTAVNNGVSAFKKKLMN